MQPERPEPSLVFIVEDNSDDEALTIRALRKFEPLSEVIVSRDGEKAVETVRAFTRVPDLILLDLKLPKLNGIEVLSVIRSIGATKSIPTIMLTSSDEPSDLVNCYDAGASGFVRKPVAYDDYVEAVKTIGRFWLGLNLSPRRG